ncbi:MAG: hypothetical protein JSV17_15895 [Candidatus Aminicenantes bacterium]|nr:MAG: hypothetical protein JSV17_15895 [Candidatus Aminicenantes bacterium]
MPFGTILNIVIVFVFIIAFFHAETIKPRIILASIMAIIIFLPQFVAMPPASLLWYLHYIGKILFGLACVIYIKWAGLAY